MKNNRIFILPFPAREPCRAPRVFSRRNVPENPGHAAIFPAEIPGGDQKLDFALHGCLPPRKPLPPPGGGPEGGNIRPLPPPAPSRPATSSVESREGEIPGRRPGRAKAHPPGLSLGRRPAGPNLEPGRGKALTSNSRWFQISPSSAGGGVGSSPPGGASAPEGEWGKDGFSLPQPSRREGGKTQGRGGKGPLPQIPSPSGMGGEAASPWCVMLCAVDPISPAGDPPVPGGGNVLPFHGVCAGGGEARPRRAGGDRWRSSKGRWPWSRGRRRG